MRFNNLLHSNEQQIFKTQKYVRDQDTWDQQKNTFGGCLNVVCLRWLFLWSRLSTALVLNLLRFEIVCNISKLRTTALQQLQSHQWLHMLLLPPPENKCSGASSTRWRSTYRGEINHTCTMDTHALCYTFNISHGEDSLQTSIPSPFFLSPSSFLLPQKASWNFLVSFSIRL